MSAVRWPVGLYIVEIEKLEHGIYHWDLLDIAGDSLIPFDDADMQVVDSHEAAMSRALGKASFLYMKLEDVEIPRKTSSKPAPVQLTEKTEAEVVAELIEEMTDSWSGQRRAAAKRGLVDVPVSVMQIRKAAPSWSKHSLKVFLQRDTGVFSEVHDLLPLENDTDFQYKATLKNNLQQVLCKAWMPVYVGGPGALRLILQPLLDEIMSWEPSSDAAGFDFSSIPTINEIIESLGTHPTQIPSVIFSDLLARLKFAMETFADHHPYTFKRMVADAYLTCLILSQEGV